MNTLRDDARRLSKFPTTIFEVERTFTQALIALACAILALFFAGGLLFLFVSMTPYHYFDGGSAWALIYLIVLLALLSLIIFATSALVKVILLAEKINVPYTKVFVIMTYAWIPAILSLALFLLPLFGIVYSAHLSVIGIMQRFKVEKSTALRAVLLSVFLTVIIPFAVLMILTYFMLNMLLFQGRF